MFENKVVKRIPGVTSVSPKEKQGYIEDLGKLSKVQLLELLERQNSLLRNRGFIKHLPDKGKKILAFKCKIESELDRQKEVDKTSALLEKLNINCPVEEIEWTGKYSEGKADDCEETLKGDDDETKVMRILASNGRTTKIERVLKPPEELVTKKDLEEINSIKDPYAQNLGLKVAEISSRRTKACFKPFRTLKEQGGPFPSQRPSSSSQSDGHNPKDSGGVLPKVEASVVKEEEEKRNRKDSTLSEDGTKRVRHWEITEATPLPPVHEKTLLLDVEVSFALEKAAVEKTIEARTKQSMARLAEQLQKGSFTKYRETKEVSSDDDDDDDEEENDKKKEEQEECGDEDEEPERDVAIIYSVVD
ncbi:DNA-directed RNA polymerase II subunit GRINL1A isoform X2 [Hetaerina americana]